MNRSSGKVLNEERLSQLEKGKPDLNEPMVSQSGDSGLFIDSHIHLDLYDGDAQNHILTSVHEYGVSGLLAVSMNLESCRRTHRLYKQYPDLVLPAFGFHPEQPLPNEKELDQLFAWMEAHKDEMAAVGEVGLPYYTRLESMSADKVDPNTTNSAESSFDDEPYIALLERFIIAAKEWNKPIVLHAVYEDAVVACDLLEKYCWNHAHFHWFKGDQQTTERMASNGYYISFTPDLLYEAEIQELAKTYPLVQIMVETDGPWPFEGPFEGQMTNPRMLQDIVRKLSELKGFSVEETERIVYHNTRKFYNLDSDYHNLSSSLLMP